MSTAPMDYEQAGELKIGQVGIANLRIRTLDVERLAQEMTARVRRAPAMFDRAAIVLDFGGLSQVPDAATARELIEALRGAGVLPVALAYGSSDTDRLARELGLPLLAKFRAAYEQGAGEPPARPAPAASPAPAAAAPEPAPAPRAATPTASPGLVHAPLVRSGQQVYADNRDLTVLAGVSAGAEVIADGSVHIYGPLRGRALAGAQGNEQARIFCREFHAELVAIAGHYKVMDDLPAGLRGKAVQVWLEDGQLCVEAQGTQ